MSDFLDRRKLPHLRIIMVHKTVLTLTQPSSPSTAHVRLSLSGRTHLTSVSVSFTLQCPAPLAPLIPIPNSPNTAFIHEQNVSAGRCPRSSSSVGRPFQSLIASCLEIRPMGSALPPPAPWPAVSPLAAHTLGKAVKADFSFVRQQRMPPPRRRRPLINGRNPRKS